MHRILLGITEHIIREENRRHGTFLMKKCIAFDFKNFALFL